MIQQTFTVIVTALHDQPRSLTGEEILVLLQDYTLRSVCPRLVFTNITEKEEKKP